MREDVKLLKAEVKKLRADLVHAREQTGRMGLCLLEAQEALEETKKHLAKCACGAKLGE